MQTCSFKNYDYLEPDKSTISDIAFFICTCDFPTLHDHEYWEFTIMTKGKLINYIQGRKVILSVGDIAIIRPTDKHRLLYTEDPNIEYINFVVRKSLMDNLISCLGIDNSIFESEMPITINVEKHSVESLHNSILLLQKEISVKQRNLRKSSILIKIMSLLQKDLLQASQVIESSFLSIVNKINKYLKEESNLADVNVNVLSKKLYINRVTLNRQMQKNLGITTHEFIIRFKLNYAQQLLITSDISVCEISLKAGFFSQSNFTKLFNAQFGCTPAKYRLKYND